MRTQHAHERSTSLLYICYLGITEPLVQTQVVPYLGGLAAAGHGVALLTFEPRRLSASVRRAYQQTLRRQAIDWYALRYHKRPALPATVVDIVAGIAYAAYLVCKRRVQVIHARSHVPAVMALALKRLLRTRFVFDIRGLMAEEYVDAGLWRRDGLLFRLVKRVDGVLLRQADAAVVLTRRARRWLFDDRNAGRGGHAPVEVIPCCVDLKRFDVNPSRVAELRNRLGFDARPVMVYAGKLGGRYTTRDMVDFFCVARRQFAELRFLILTQSPTAIVEDEFARRGVGEDSYCCLEVSPEELPAHLALADFAIFFLASGFSQIAASPTKIGEYLAAGLPVVCSSGIGDLEDLTDEEVGAAVTAFNTAEYERAARRIRTLLDDGEIAARRCRAAAQRHFSLATVGVPGYLRLYAALTGGRTATTTAVAGGAAVVGEAPRESAVR